jgi:hypothetical protein
MGELFTSPRVGTCKPRASRPQSSRPRLGACQRHAEICKEEVPRRATPAEARLPARKARPAAVNMTSPNGRGARLAFRKPAKPTSILVVGSRGRRSCGLSRRSQFVVGGGGEKAQRLPPLEGVYLQPPGLNPRLRVCVLARLACRICTSSRSEAHGESHACQQRNHQLARSAHFHSLIHAAGTRGRQNESDRVRGRYKGRRSEPPS